ncbi:NADH:flavin oxidoreductase/NADH oxidase [Pedobacter cryotolerans]|uniref:NADH:flavin oxidoreductase/NADH oxidase n=1 Tax=Pedobacter cryotolerans TaxID=2571270 RepID=A0A4U1CDJ6_9SPHI|nr:NADH:flavin oxidoreductase/NADH oxidase [Pedobacter cryotolerans]TKC02074.1 NADH:flavin oxidoreductase/NADH oxidase [Pedobacter cryotolerans]
MSLLFSPIKIKNIELKNRIVVSPMCQYSAKDGFPNNWHLVHLGSRAVGGAGLIIAEATGVSPEARISVGDLGLWKDEQIEKFKEIVDFIHENGSIAGIQLAHAGRKASFDIPWENPLQLDKDQGGWDTVSASSEIFNPTDKTPIALDLQGIAKVKADFKSATERAIKAGFKVIEIHAAHGYLQHQFLSPISNKRTDEYGGIFENRIRLLMETVTAVQEVWPAENPLFVRISATDWAEGGWNLEESIRLSALLKEKGVDVIDTSSGGLTLAQQIPLKPGYQVEFAAAIKKEVGIKTGAVGLITDENQAEEILQNGHADLIFMARELLRSPYFPLDAAFKLGDDVKWPAQYERAKPRKHS